MTEMIKAEIEKAKVEYNGYKNETISDDRAFSYVLLKNFFAVDDIGDRFDFVTDGQNDGGIDFLYFDDEESKLVLCQSKCTEDLSYQDIEVELDKINSTVVNFRNGNTGSYNDRLKKILQNAMDRLPEDNPDNIYFYLFTTAQIDVKEAFKKINNTIHAFQPDVVSLFSQDDIENKIREVQESLDTVLYEKVKIDKAKNYLEYENDEAKGVIVNVLSTSLVKLYNKYSTKGLFDLNIRRYIADKMVDSGINRTLDKGRENFWFLNNGIIIACKDFDIDGDTVNIHGFSIVNGGQTTTLIGKYKGTNQKEFSIPCKIVSSKNDQKEGKHNIQFFTGIAEATNSQKPILPRDLKSNSPEMLCLSKMLADNDIYLEIKRGVKADKRYQYSIKNDELGQLILSMVMQRPGTSRSGKKTMFDSPEIYSKIFKVNYEKDASKKGFLMDLVQLNDRYTLIEEYIKKHNLNEEQAEILKNGKQVIFSFLGVVYRLANNDVTEIELNSDTGIVKTSEFTYGKFISCYTGNDIDAKLKKIIIDLVKLATESYTIAYNSKLCTSVSNYFKRDNMYIDNILTHLVDCLSMSIGEDIKDNMDIFRR